MPASAATSSLSLVSPVTPTAPMGKPSAPLTITPPATGTSPFAVRCPSEAMKLGRPAAIFADAPRIDAQRQRARRLAAGDVQPQEAGAVLALDFVSRARHLA